MNEITQIQFMIEVLPGKLPELAIDAAIRLNATSVILDRYSNSFKHLFSMIISNFKYIYFNYFQPYKQD
jgi:hypothetical protein